MRDFLAGKLRDGFWFNPLRRVVDWAYRTLSLGHHFNEWLKKSGRAVVGASESYQAVSLGLICVGVFSVTGSVAPWNSAALRVVGGTAVLYRACEILLFSVHWLFEPGSIVSARRSLVAFLINLVELSGALLILAVLAGCEGAFGGFAALGAGFALAFQLEPPAWTGSGICTAAARGHVLVGGVLVLLVLASVVGSVTRDEEEHIDNK